MSLYQKYRPQSLSEIKGNEDIIDSLTKMLSDLKKCPHVFLLHGPTGTGKTTIARIISNMVGCKGNDYVEINASDQSGIDDVRNIIKNSQYRPLESKYRVWVIDECQRWTSDAQNAALKILEDTPEHVFFILCTTDPNKLKKTIQGRCQIFQTKLLSDIQLIGLLRRVVKGEGQNVDVKVLEQIVKNSLGHPRNALNILEQVLSVPSDRQIEMAETISGEQVKSIELARALLKGARWKEVSSILNGLKDQEPESIRRMILGYCQSVLLNDDNERCGLIMEMMINNTYDCGFSMLVYLCYSITKNK
jgi:DNA polymerase-3 subunit gamma/tau